MSRERFVRERSADWASLRSLLDSFEAKGRRTRREEAAAELPLLYRRLCQDLAQSRSRGYGPTLTEELNQLALRGHRLLHRRPPSSLLRFLLFLGVGLPRLVRAHAGLFWVSTFAFLVPLVLVVLLASAEPRWIEAVLGPEGADSIGEMYSKDSQRIGRPAGADSQMFGFYIHNNIGIDFRTFAGGVLAGVGTLLVLAFNGLFLGAAVAQIHRLGYETTFYSFVCGHSSFELLGMVLSGMAGLVLGRAILAPGRRTRGHALREDGKVALKLLAGGATMTLFAAFVEGFWSAGPAPVGGKYLVAAVLWSTLCLHLGLAGRERAR